MKKQGKMKKSIIIVVLITLFCISCSGAVIEENIEEIKVIDEVEMVEDVVQKKDNEIEYFEPQIFGCSWAIVSFNVIGTQEKEDPIEYEIQLSDGVHVISQKADFVDGKGYAVFENLNDSTQYTMSICTVIGDVKKVCEDTFEFVMPEREISLTDIDMYINDEIDEHTGSKENQVLLEIQACLSLLGLESGRYGHFDPVTQSNLCQIEYSLNTRGRYVKYDNILAVPNEKTLNAMKDILSRNLTTPSDIIQDFTPADYELSEYAIIDTSGGKLDIERYVLDLIEGNEAIKQIYIDYPYDVESDAFKTLYKEEYEKGSTIESLELRLRQYAAKNKAQFSWKAEEFLLDIAKPAQRLIVMAGSNNKITVNTMIAYSYLFMDAFRATGGQFMTSTTYRDYTFQWKLYSKGGGKSVASRHNPSWHYNRQVYSYVPGFSNHQYGVAIDFHDRTTFHETKLYEFLNENGYKYGFYNYLIEPWHWVYLGEME